MSVQKYLVTFLFVHFYIYAFFFSFFVCFVSHETNESHWASTDSDVATRFNGTSETFSSSPSSPSSATLCCCCCALTSVFKC